MLTAEGNYKLKSTWKECSVDIGCCVVTLKTCRRNQKPTKGCRCRSGFSAKASECPAVLHAADYTPSGKEPWRHTAREQAEGEAKTNSLNVHLTIRAELDSQYGALDT